MQPDRVSRTPRRLRAAGGRRVSGHAAAQGQQSAYEQAAKAKPEFRPLALATLDYARRGITTIQEVFRLAEEIEEAPQNEEPTDEKMPDLVVEHDGLPRDTDSFEGAGEPLEGGVEAYIGE